MNKSLRQRSVSTIGKFLLSFGLLAMSVLFALSLVLYKKDKRMELAVMGFALAMALTISGVTATMRDRAEARRAAAIAVQNAQSAQSALVVAASVNETWFSQPDGSYLHADGTGADVPQPGAPANPTGPELPQSVPAPAGGSGGTWGAGSTTDEITGSLDRTAYWVSDGESYHFSASCPSLARSTNIQAGTLQDVLNAGKTDPCNNCANGS